MKFAIGIEYDGTDYSGWQRQTSEITVQGCIEKALTEVANHPIEIQCAGRTDASVHAIGQVAHFESDAKRDDRAWIMGANANLPSGIRLRWVKAVPDDFHARFSATARAYRYIIYNEKIRPGILRRFVSWHPHYLDEKNMHEAGQALLGKNDFTSFRSSSCQAHTAIRNIHYLNVTRKNSLVFLEVKANAFLHHMVRNIVGVLMPIGEGEKPINWVKEVLEAKDRTQAGVTANGQGLCLVGVDYDEKYDLPETKKGIWF